MFYKGSMFLIFFILNLGSVNCQDHTIEIKNYFSDAELLPDNERVLYLVNGNPPILYNYKTDKKEIAYKVDKTYKNSTYETMALSPDGKYFALRMGRSDIVIYDVNEKGSVFTLAGPADEWVSYIISFSNESKYLLIKKMSSRHYMQYEVGSWKLVGKIEKKQEVLSNDCLVYYNRNKPKQTVEIIDLKTDKLISEIALKDHAIEAGYRHVHFGDKNDEIHIFSYARKQHDIIHGCWDLRNSQLKYTRVLQHEKKTASTSIKVLSINEKRIVVVDWDKQKNGRVIVLEDTKISKSKYLELEGEWIYPNGLQTNSTGQMLMIRNYKGESNKLCIWDLNKLE